MSRIIQLIFTGVVILNLLACQSAGSRNQTQKVAVNKTDTCLTNPAHTYRVFIPAHNETTNELSLLVAIDSHGSGQNAVNHLRDAVTKYPAILVASNLIQNNDPHYIQELDELIADVKKRYSAGQRIYLLGFSGGARMALNYATNHPVNGVIACSAFADSKQLALIKCPVTGIIGMDDFNFPEVACYILQPETTPAHVQIELSKASHEWPSSKDLADVFAWFQLSGESAKKQEITKYIDAQKQRIDSLVKTDELLQAACVSRNMSSAEAFEKAGNFRSSTVQLRNNADYLEQIDQLTESLQFEGKMRQFYGQALFQKDEKWWATEITALNEKTITEPNAMKQMAYKRLKGFIGIVCYSYSRQMANPKDIPHLEQILMVYRIAEPDNADMKRFYAELNELKGR